MLLDCTPFHFSYTVPLRSWKILHFVRWKMEMFAFFVKSLGKRRKFIKNIYNVRQKKFAREKKFAKMFTKCKRKFSNFFSKVFVRWKPEKSLTHLLLCSKKIIFSFFWRHFLIQINDKDFSVTLNAFFVVRWQDKRLVMDKEKIILNLGKL